MYRQIYIRIAIFIFIIFNISFAEKKESTGMTFPITINRLQSQYAPIEIFEIKGLNLVDSNYISQNQHIGKIKYQGVKKDSYVDSSGKYIYFTHQIGDDDLYLPLAMSIDEYFKLKKYYILHQAITKMGIENTTIKKAEGSGRKLELIGADIAGQRVALRVSGNINISGQMNNRERSQVASNIQDGKSMDFKIDQKMRFNIEGTIGDRVSILVDQDSERSFDFENNMRIHYTGKEDEIIQKISAGNISLSLPGTKFVTFSSKNSGLFGIKAELKFGPINVTTIASVEKGEKQKLSYDGGSDKQEQIIEDWNYVTNKYFYLDKKYRSTFWNEYKDKGILSVGNRVVKNLEVYKSVNIVSSNTIRGGAAYVDPGDTSLYQERIQKTDFERLELNRDYFYSANLGYLTMKKRPGENEVLAVAYKVVDYYDENNTLEEYGDWNRDPLDTTGIILKLIKPRSMNSQSHPCWDLSWRNVYYLGASNIDSSGFDLQIAYDGASGLEERDKGDGKTYLEKFGLDMRDASGNPGQDDMIDGQPVVNLYTGELWFPYLHPFSYDESGLEGNPNIDTVLSCDMMYENSRTNKQAQIKSDMKFRIKVKYENTSSIISLGPMVMEGSEEITLNNQRLNKGSDYLIDYMGGILTLLNENATAPNAKLDVKFEKNSFFQLKKKTILGARAQWDFGPDKKNFIGATGLYYSKSVIDDKVDVGYEPMANFVFDLNGRYQKDLKFLTKAIDRLPLLSTDKKSTFAFEGEIAQVLPNPNTINNSETGDNNGVAYIDDFEGSKRTISPVMTKGFWSKSSVPLVKEETTLNGQNELAGHTYWYVDYTGIDVREIWPDRDVGRKQSDRTISPLYLNLEPEAATRVGVHASDEQKKEAWGGITYFFPSTSFDQSDTKYIDIWMKGSVGNLHIDLGTISEDQIPNGKLNTEDAKDFPNNIYDKGEDVGLDEIPNEEEVLIVRHYNTLELDTLYPGDEELTDYLRYDLDDPHLDDFNYEAGTRDRMKLRTTNGTEDNKNDASAGGRPDTENKNTNPDLDDINNYMTINLPLDNTDNRFLASNNKGWKLYRIPLAEFELENGCVEDAFSWEQVEALRLWIDGVAKDTEIAFAKIEMVRNEWRDMGIVLGEDNGIFITSDSTFIKEEKIFGVSVKNTEENDDYTPPKGVEGEYDKVNEVQRKEQSLVLKIYGDIDGSPGLLPMEIASAEKDLLEELSLINYKRLKMFINGFEIEDDAHGLYYEGEKTPLIYYLRFGKGGASQQYYELRQPIYVGWDNKNKIDVDIDFMTSLKKYNTIDEYTPKNNVGLQELWIEPHPEWGEIRIYKEVKEGEYTGKEIIIYGTPAISRIMRMETGLINTGNEPISGEIWMDELRLSDVRKNAGIATRASFKLNFADVASINMSIDRKDADFHRVEEQPSANASSLNNTNNISTNVNLSLHKFFPTKLGLNFPITASMNQRESKPKYLPGTDILAGENPPDSIRSISQSYSINTSISKKTSDFWLTKYTIDQLKMNFAAGWTETSDRQTALSTTSKYSGGLSYGIPFGRDNFIQLLKWTEKVPFFGEKYSETKFYYTPDKFTLNVSAAENMNDKDPRLGESTSNHTMGMNHSYNLGYKLTDNLKSTYSRKMKNNMNEIVDDKMNNFKQFKFGTNESVVETYNFSFSPQIFSWLTPQLTYSSNYTWNNPIASQLRSIDQLSNSNTINASTSLNIAQIFKSFYTKAKPKKSASSKSSRSGATNRGGSRSRAPRSSKTPKDTKSKTEHVFLDGIHKWLDKINTIQVTYAINNSINNKGRVVGTPEFAYRMGFSQDPGLDTISAEAGTGFDNPLTSNSLSLRSGLTIIKSITTTFSYATKNSVSMTQNVRSENRSQDYFPMGKDGKDGFPFPSWQVRIGGLEKIPFLDKVFSTLSASHSFTGKEQVTIKDTVEQMSSYRYGFQPLISMSMKFKNKMSSDFRVTTGKTITNNPQGVSVSNQFGAAFNMSYKRKGGITIPLPFMEKKRLENNIDFTLSLEYSASNTEQKQNTMEKFTTTDDRSSFSIKPRIGYSFTSKVTGGAFLQYQIIDDKRIGERKNMNYGFDVNIAIRG